MNIDKERKKEMTEVFLNVDELNDEDVVITITDEDGIFIDELGVILWTMKI